MFYPPVYNPDEPLQIMAYTRFRILELHAYLHKDNDAEKDLNYLVSNYPMATPGYLFARGPIYSGKLIRRTTISATRVRQY